MACKARGLDVCELRGSQPVLSRALLRLLFTGVVPKDFAFRFSRSKRIGYAGWAIKQLPS